MLKPVKRQKKVAAPADDDGALERAEEAEAAASTHPAKPRRAATVNDPALLLKLEELTGGLDPEATDEAWIESLVVTAPAALELDDAEDDLKREMAFYNQALAAVTSAQGRMDRMGVPYLRPEDYFAEMMKSDEHMSKVKRRMIQQQQEIIGQEQRRKQRTAKKFGKQVQIAKLQERAQQRKAEMTSVVNSKKGRGVGVSDFDVGIDEDDNYDSAKRGRGDDGGQRLRRTVRATHARRVRHHSRARATSDGGRRTHQGGGALPPAPPARARDRWR